MVILIRPLMLDRNHTDQVVSE